MANPFQEYERARSLPLSALVAVMQGKSDVVSLGVAHAAIKEKTEAEIAKKGAQAVQMAQAPKVKDKDLAMAQGLASTPADLNVPMGGIVGGEGDMTQTAAGGGSVVAFQTGGQMQLPFNDPLKRTLMSTQTPGAGVSFSQAFAGRNIPKKNFIERGLGALRNMPYAGKAFRLASSPMAATAQLGLRSPDLNVGEQEYLDLIRKLQSLGYPAETIEAMSPDQRVAAATRGEQLPAGPVDTGGVSTQTLAQMEAAQAAPPEGAPAPGGGPAAPTGVAQTQVAPSTVEPPLSFDDADKLAEQLMGKYKIEPGKRKEFTDFSKEYVDTLKNAGYDFDLVKNQVKELAKEKEALKGEKKEAANLRLLEAGLGILGGESPYAFVNIGKGATPALQGLAKDLKEIKKTSRQLDKETMQLNLLQNQMAEGKVKYSQDRLDKQEDRFQRIVEKDMDNRLSLAKTLSSNAVTKYATDKGADTSLQVAQIGATKEGDISREISQMPGNTRMEKVKNFYKASTRTTDPAQAAYIKTLEKYATEDPGGRKLEKLKESNPALYARIKQDLATYGLSTGMLTEKPDSGPIRN
jgi:hypothetical protein